jgi:hypothetical protein
LDILFREIDISNTKFIHFGKNTLHSFQQKTLMTTENKDQKLPTYNILGNSGLRVFPLALGTMGYGEPAGMTSPLHLTIKALIKS